MAIMAYWLVLPFGITNTITRVLPLPSLGPRTPRHTGTFIDCFSIAQLLINANDYSVGEYRISASAGVAMFSGVDVELYIDCPVTDYCLALSGSTPQLIARPVLVSDHLCVNQ